MSPELEKYILKKYPKIFGLKRSNHSIYLYSFNCGDGWFNIIDQLCANIQHHIDHSRNTRAHRIKYNRALKRAINGDIKGLHHYYSTDGDVDSWAKQRAADDVQMYYNSSDKKFRELPEKLDQVIATQVKEKFGELRFYINGGDEYVYGLIAMASSISTVTCEVCGNLGNISGKGWLRATCKTHSK